MGDKTKGIQGSVSKTGELRLVTEYTPGLEDVGLDSDVTA